LIKGKLSEDQPKKSNWTNKRLRFRGFWSFTLANVLNNTFTLPQDTPAFLRTTFTNFEKFALDLLACLVLDSKLKKAHSVFLDSQKKFKKVYFTWFKGVDTKNKILR